MAFLLYTRRGCHLCETAADWIAAWAEAGAVTAIDVDDFPELRRQFGDRVPVVVADGHVLLEGRFDEAEVSRLFGGGATGRVSGPAGRAP